MRYPFILTNEVLELLTKATSIKRNEYLPHGYFTKPMFYDKKKSLYIFTKSSNINNKKVMDIEKVDHILDDFLISYLNKYDFKTETYGLGNAIMTFIIFNDRLAYLYSTSSVDPTINDNLLLAFFANHPNYEVLTNYSNNEVIGLPSELIPLYFESNLKIDLNSDEFDFFTLEGIKNGWFSMFSKQGKSYSMFDGTTFYHTKSSSIDPTVDDCIYSDELGYITLMRATPIYKKVNKLTIKEVDYYTFINYYMNEIKEDKEEDISLALTGVKYTGGKFYIALLDDKWVGSFILEEKGDNFIYLSFVALIKEVRGNNLGVELVQLALNEISKTQLDCVIGVIEQKLFKMYHGLGFKDVGYWRSK